MSLAFLCTLSVNLCPDLSTCVRAWCLVRSRHPPLKQVRQTSTPSGPSYFEFDSQITVNHLLSRNWETPCLIIETLCTFFAMNALRKPRGLKMGNLVYMGARHLAFWSFVNDIGSICDRIVVVQGQRSKTHKIDQNSPQLHTVM